MTPATLVMFSVIGVAIVGFFAWLGTSVVGIKMDVVEIKLNVKSLLGTRTAQEAERGVGLDQRVTNLEHVAPTRPQAEADIAADAADETAAAAVDKADKIRKAPKS